MSVIAKPPSGLAVSDDTLIADALRVLDTEIAGLQGLRGLIGQPIADAARIILAAKGYVTVTGVGKSGHIGRKIAATMTSTGTPAFFIHPTEMSHGDLGALREDGVLVAISNSGESRELRDPLRFCHANGIPIIAVTRNPDSMLGRLARSVLRLADTPEACPNGLAPTTSTTMTLALGDALAIAVMSARGFGREDFGQRHPGGMLGLQLQKVADWMRTDNPHPGVPSVARDAPIAAVIEAVTVGRLGCVAVTEADGRLAGIITDGDLRRAIDPGMFGKRAEAIMTAHPVTCTPEDRMGDIIPILTERKITSILVVEAARPVAVIHIQDLMRGGYMG